MLALAGSLHPNLLHRDEVQKNCFFAPITICMGANVWLYALNMVLMCLIAFVFVVFMSILSNKVCEFSLSFCTMAFYVAPCKILHLHLLHIGAAESRCKDPALISIGKLDLSCDIVCMYETIFEETLIGNTNIQCYLWFNPMIPESKSGHAQKKQHVIILNVNWCGFWLI